jgi:hypothetical protein
MRMRKTVSASDDASKTRSGIARELIPHDLATEIVSLALLLAVVALACRIASIW